MQYSIMKKCHGVVWFCQVLEMSALVRIMILAIYDEQSNSLNTIKVLMLFDIF